MSEVKKGDKLPETLIYYLPPSVGEACSFAPVKIDINKLEHPTLIVVVPGAFTPTCSEKHIPPYLTTTSITLLKKAGIKNVIILSTDSPFVTKAWGEKLVADKPEVFKELVDGYIKFASDAGGELLKSLGLVGEPVDLFAKNGLRGLRSAIILGTGGVVQYVGVDRVRGTVEESGIEGVLKALAGQ